MGRTTIAPAQAHRIRVILASMPPTIDYPWQPWQPGLQPVGKIHALNAWLRRYAAAHGATYLDYYSVLAMPQGGMRAGLAGDGVNPTPAGYAIMASLPIERALARLTIMLGPAACRQCISGIPAGVAPPCRCPRLCRRC
jgi:hypothetical protein